MASVVVVDRTVVSYWTLTDLLYWLKQMMSLFTKPIREKYPEKDIS